MLEALNQPVKTLVYEFGINDWTELLDEEFATLLEHDQFRERYPDAADRRAKAGGMRPRKNSAPTLGFADYLALFDDGYFGLCPVCKKGVPYLNVGRNHYSYCEADKVYWPIGSNLFSGWQDETQEAWDKNEALLDQATEAEPVYRGRNGGFVTDPRESIHASTAPDGRQRS